MEVNAPNRPKLDAKSIRKIIAAKGLTVGKVLIVGIRGYFEDSMGAAGKNDRGIYDDALFVVLPDRVVAFNGNTDPAAFERGIATLKPGVWRFRAGKHKLSSPTGYPAFRQYGNMTVLRDGAGEDTGYFGINLHRGGKAGTSSLGCQTVPPAQWDEFRKLVQKALGVDDKKVTASPSGVGDPFTYLLITNAEKEALLK